MTNFSIKSILDFGNIKLLVTINLLPNFQCLIKHIGSIIETNRMLADFAFLPRLSNDSPTEIFMGPNCLQKFGPFTKTASKEFLLEELAEVQ